MGEVIPSAVTQETIVISERRNIIGRYIFRGKGIPGEAR